MKTGRKYGEKEKMQILIKSLIFRTLQIYIFSFYAFLFFVSLAVYIITVIKVKLSIFFFWQANNYAHSLAISKHITTFVL